MLGYYGGFNPMKEPPVPIVSWIHFGVTVVILLLVIVILATRGKEGFKTSRGIYYPDGQMIIADIPQKITVDGQEMTNPFWDTVSENWEKTDKDFNGYPVWKMK